MGYTFYVLHGPEVGDVLHEARIVIRHYLSNGLFEEPRPLHYQPVPDVLELDKGASNIGSQLNPITDTDKLLFISEKVTIPPHRKLNNDNCLIMIWYYYERFYVELRDVLETMPVNKMVVDRKKLPGAPGHGLHIAFLPDPLLEIASQGLLVGVEFSL